MSSPANPELDQASKSLLETPQASSSYHIHKLFVDGGETIRQQATNTPTEHTTAVAIDRENTVLRETGFRVSEEDTCNLLIEGVVADTSQVWTEPQLLEQTERNVISTYHNGALVKPLFDRSFAEEFGLVDHEERPAFRERILMTREGELLEYEFDRVLARVVAVCTDKFTHDHSGHFPYDISVLLEAAGSVIKHLSMEDIYGKRLEKALANHKDPRALMTANEVLTTLMNNVAARHFADKRYPFLYSAARKHQHSRRRSDRPNRRAGRGSYVTIHPVDNDHTRTPHAKIGKVFRDAGAFVDQSLLQFIEVADGDVETVNIGALEALAAVINTTKSQRRIAA